MSQFKINNTVIGINRPAYIIAELSANHVQDFNIAIKTIEAMKKAGANAVKIQSYLPESIALDSDKPWFRTRDDSPWAGRRLVEVYQKGFTPWAWHEKLRDFASDLGLDFFSSPFDHKFVDLLESIDMPAYKIASLEITDIPLIKKVAKTNKPIILSTGAATKEDIERAVTTCNQEGNHQIALLKCTSAYPTPLEEVNLNMIKTMQKDYDCIIGLSDHTTGILIPASAVALGAKIIEKHFILDKQLNSLDKDFSLSPREFKEMVDAVRNIEKALGDGSYLATNRMKNAQNFTRSIFAVKNIKKGEQFDTNNIRTLRPNKGLHPMYYDRVIGTRAAEDIEAGTPLKWEHFVKTNKD